MVQQATRPIGQDPLGLEELLATSLSIPEQATPNGGGFPCPRALDWELR
jgi:hypothetical protein